MAKACLILWAEIVGNDEVSGSHYQSIRNFITGEVSDDSIIRIDSRTLPMDDDKFGPSPCIVWVGSNGGGEVNGYFRLFGVLGWKICLCKRGGISDTSAGLISDPENPENWDFGENIGQLFNYDWVTNESTELDYEKVKSSLGIILDRAHKRSVSAMIDETINEVATEVGATDFVFNTEETWNNFVGFLSAKLTYTLLKIPSNRQLNPKQ